MWTMFWTRQIRTKGTRKYKVDWKKKKRPASFWIRSLETIKEGNKEATEEQQRPKNYNSKNGNLKSEEKVTGVEWQTRRTAVDGAASPVPGNWLEILSHVSAAEMLCGSFHSRLRSNIRLPVAEGTKCNSQEVSWKTSVTCCNVTLNHEVVPWVRLSNVSYASKKEALSTRHLANAPGSLTAERTRCFPQCTQVVLQKS